MKKLIFLSLYIIISFCVYSQNKDYIFDHLDAQYGLSHPAVNCIVQDSTGFLWVGTQNGLNRYDGYSFKVYKSYEQEQNGLTNNRIKALLVDKHGVLWVGTAGGGLLRYKKESDSFESFIHDDKNENSISSNDVYAICEDSNDNLWIGTYGGGLNKYNPYSKKFTRFTNNPQNQKSLSNNNIRAVYVDKAGNVWVGSDGGGLDLLKNQSAEFIHYKSNPSNQNTLSNNVVMCIKEDKFNNLWIGTYLGGLNLFNKKTNLFQRINKQSEDLNSLSNNIIWDIFFENDTTAWLATRGGGIDVFNLKTKEINFIKYNGENANSLNSNSILCVFKDREGIIWAGSEDKGLNKLNMQKQNFKQLSNNEEIRKVLFKTRIASFIEDRPNCWWIGTYGSGLYYYDKNKEQLIQYTTKTHPAVSGNTIISLQKDKQNNLWIGTDGEGVDVMNLSTKTIVNYRYNNQPGSLSNDAVHDIIMDRSGVMWLGTWGGGLNKFNPITKTFTHYTISDDPQKNVAFCVYEDLMQNIWVGTYGSGLALLDKKHGSFSYFLENNAIFSMCQNKDKNILWIATQGNGIIKMQIPSKLCEGITEKNGLSNDVVNGVAFDSNNKLWITTINGLCQLNPTDNSIKRYDVNDGLISNTYTPQTILLTFDGKIMTGGVNGINIFDPRDIKSAKTIPTVIITNFYVYNQEVKSGSIVKGQSILEKDISLTSQIVIPYNLNVISFDFTAIDLANSNKLKFAYMLEGLDKDWTYTDSRRRNITYAQLSPGVYTLRIKSTNGDGKWCDNYKELKIIVNPPFWKTTWFYILIFIVFFLSIFSYLRYKTIQIAKSKDELEIKIKERTLELELRNEEIVRQAGKIMIQNEQITDQNEVLAKQQTELEVHKNNLEQMVNQRTRELKQALRKADESDSLKTAFLANISHEIRTPMNAIIGFADLLSFPSISDENKMKYINMIKSNGEMLVKMIENIIDLSKVQTGQITINKKECDVNLMLLELKNTFESVIVLEGKQIELKIDVDPRLINELVYVDEFRLLQIINNLIDNAIKYTNHGHIIVGGVYTDARPKHPEIEFYVKDTGIGIEKNQYEAIFNNFTKLESKEKFFQGTGLGLSLSKSLVGILGGRMWVESEEGKGSTFHFTIPYERNNSKGSINTSKWRGKTILIVDDQEINHTLFNEILKPFGLNLIYVKNGLQAVDLCRQYQPHLVLMDLRMPDISGYDAVSRIRAFNQTVPIIAQSAFIVINERERILSSGFNDVLTKPIDTQLLLKIIDSFFANTGENES